MQTKNAAQQITIDRLKAKGWREGMIYALWVPMYLDRPYAGLPRPCVVSVDRQGRVHRGYSRARGYRA